MKNTLVLLVIFLSTVPVSLQGETGTHEVFTCQYIQDRLQETFQYDSSEPIPLGEALALLQKKLGVSIVPDTRVLDAAGVTLNSPVTLRLPVRMPIKDVLNYVAKQHRLGGYVIKYEVVLFGANPSHEVRTVPYYVGDMVKSNENSVDFQPIIDYIQTMVSPDSWEENSIIPYYPNFCLVIKQTESVHEEIGGLLRGLRRYNNMQILFKIEVLSSGGPIDETLRNQAFTILDGQSFSIDFPWESDTVIQLTPVFGKVHERFSVMNRPLQFEIPGRSQVTIKGTVGQKDGAEAIKFSVRLDDQVLATRTFYGSPLRPEEEEEKSYLTGKGRELPY